MKKLIAIFTLSCLSLISVQAQERITESKLLGTWKMVIELDEVMAELDKEAKESETILAEVLLKSVAGVVEGVMDRVQVYIEFERGGDATLMINAFDEDTEENDTEWYIRNGKLYIEDMDDDDVNWDGDDGWYMQDGVLFLEKDDDDDDGEPVIYMVRVDD